jgi:hypothetical protein
MKELGSNQWYIFFFGFGEHCASFDRSTIKFTPGGRVEGAPS